MRHTTTSTRNRPATVLVAGLVTASVLGAGLAACDADGSGAPSPSATPSVPSSVTTTEAGEDRVAAPEVGDPADDGDDVVADTALPDSTALDPDEVAGLLWMREEEQLAHDVYVALGDTWGLRVFENIAGSEQQHIDQTIGLLERYGLPDPAAGNPVGTFTDPRMQELYDDLMAEGVTSEVAALTVGATIEELDIADLRTRAEITDEPAIDAVYARLERASRNHLRAFVGQLDLLGVEYEPTVLDDVASIVSNPIERGRDDH